MFHNWPCLNSKYGVDIETALVAISPDPLALVLKLNWNDELDPAELGNSVKSNAEVSDTTVDDLSKINWLFFEFTCLYINSIVLTGVSSEYFPPDPL